MKTQTQVIVEKKFSSNVVANKWARENGYLNDRGLATKGYTVTFLFQTGTLLVTKK
jgi:hypothetical protein